MVIGGRDMKHLFAFGLLLAMLAAAPPPPALAEDSAFLSNSKVRLADVDGNGGYRTPATAQYNIIREKMMKRQVLEEFARFLSPLRFPKTLWIYAAECDGGPGSSPYYSPPEHAMVMCYQFMKMVEDRANRIVQFENKNPKFFPMRVTRNGFIAGVFAGVVLHEAGHATFDLLDVPIFGRQEDAADEMSTFIALQFQRQVAELVVAAYADVDLTFSPTPTEAPDPNARDYPKDKASQCYLDPFCTFSDVHGTFEQRFFNTLCLTYGSDPARYANLMAGGYVPRQRDCVGEYARVKQAFATTVYPFIDQAMMKQVQARQWFTPAELR
jgi:hypothetical protein